jgi:SnoaL-like domain
MTLQYLRPANLTIKDEGEIRWILEAYGHIVDSGDWGQLHRIFTRDATFDLTAIKWGLIKGVNGLVDLWKRVEHPVGHHMSNIVILDPDGFPLEETVEYIVVSKGISVFADGTARSNVYIDRLVLTDYGWRSRHREVRRRSHEDAGWRSQDG